MSKNSKITRLRFAAREVVRQYELLHDTFASITSISQWHALLELDAHTTMNMKQLAEQLNIGKSAISRHIQQLVAQGICQFEPGPIDRRNKLVSLTQKGTMLVRKILTEIGVEIEAAMDLMSEEEFEIAVQGLSVYAHALKTSRLQRKMKRKTSLQQK